MPFLVPSNLHTLLKNLFLSICFFYLFGLFFWRVLAREDTGIRSHHGLPPLRVEWSATGSRLEHKRRLLGTLRA